MTTQTRFFARHAAIALAVSSMLYSGMALAQAPAAKVAAPAKTAKWQIPDDVVFVDAIPLGATGKMLKTKLREILKDYKLPQA